MRVAWILGIVAAGCYSPAPAPGSPCNSLGECPSGLECRSNVCELPGGDAGTDANAMVDACPSAMCVNDELVGCGVPITCDHGCAVEPPHCRILRPSNQVTTELLQGATADVSGDKWAFDTSTGRIRFGNTDLRAAGTGVIAGIRFEVVDNAGVFAARSFSLAAGQRWDVDGTNPLVLYAATTISIAGELDGTATLEIPGPGGAAGTGSTSTAPECNGRAGRFLSVQRGEGGGGGGGATSAGSGGASNGGPSTGIGGETCTARSTTIPLRGGSGGGFGAASSANSGGGGGGAMALVAMQSITITSGAAVSVSGGGGISGSLITASASGEAGGGGGAGGAILVEAPTVSVAGALTANGGSGASPSSIDGRDGTSTSAMPVAGGSFTGPGGTANGGSGGAAMIAPTNGQSYNYNDGLAQPNSQTSRGAGGGGAAGRIEIRASSIATTNAVVSPAASTSVPDYE